MMNIFLFEALLALDVVFSEFAIFRILHFRRFMVFLELRIGFAFTMTAGMPVFAIFARAFNHVLFSFWEGRGKRYAYKIINSA